MGKNIIMLRTLCGCSQVLEEDCKDPPGRFGMRILRAVRRRNVSDTCYEERYFKLMQPQKVGDDLLWQYVEE